MDKTIFLLLAVVGMIIVSGIAMPEPVPTLQPVIICAFTGPPALPCVPHD